MQYENLKNYDRSKSEILRLMWDNHFQIGFVFVEYDLFNTTTFIQNLIYILYNFDTVLYQFLETGTSDRYVLYVSFNA